MVKKLIYVLIVLLAFVAGAVIGVSLNPNQLDKIPTVKATKAEANTDPVATAKETAVASDKVQTTLVGKWQYSAGTNQTVMEFLADGSGKNHAITGTNDTITPFNWEVIDSTHIKLDSSNSLEIATMNLTQNTLSLAFADNAAQIYKRVE